MVRILGHAISRRSRTKTRPAANHAAEAIVIYDLRREGAYEMEGGERLAAAFELKPLSGAQGSGSATR